jgi:GH25 family lysozyme M1 (1,4-beta-N-acetylmuramidase)
MAIPELPWQTNDAHHLRGIDVSAHQTPGRLTLSGLDFVIARATYGDRVDQTARAWAASATDAGVQRFSLYAFARHSARVEHAPERQIKAIREAVAAVREKWKGPLAVWLDAEENTSFDGPFVRDRALDIYRTIAEDLRGSALAQPLAPGGLPVGLYTAPGWWSALRAPAEWATLPTWLAHYGTRTATRPAAGAFPRFGIWQFGLVRHGGFAVDGNVAAGWRTDHPWPLICESEPTPPPAAPASNVRKLLDEADAQIDAAQVSLKAAWAKVSEARAALK